MQDSRRRFLEKAARGLLGAGVAYVSIPTLLQKARPARAAQEPPTGGYDWTKHSWGFVVDTTKCIGCGRCVLACKLENDVPFEAEFSRTWVERYVLLDDGEILVDSPEAAIHGFIKVPLHEKYGDLEIQDTFFVPKLCNHCDNPPCVQVCPVGATYQTKDGVVLVDREYCVGCRYCIQACPYGARFLDPRYHVADKCTWCYHRITKGRLPACVEACPAEARIFGDLMDPDSSVSKILREERINVLKPDLGTKPSVYYIGLREGVR